MNDKLKPDNDPEKPVTPDQHRPGHKAADRTVFNPNAANRGKHPQQPNGSAAQTRAQHVDPTNIKRHPQANQDATRVKANPALQNNADTRVRPAGQAVRNNGFVPDTPGNARHQVLKGRFTLEKVIGVGGMGVVYKAKDRLKVEARDREPFVAIKVLSDEFKTHPESFIALQRESRKTQRISHPNVVKVYDFDRDGDIVFMTMEYMEGRPLDELVKQYKATGLPRDDVWNILSGLCSALIHAHQENIVHSDFKPGNIFITDAGIPKIFDFGIARAVANVDRQSGKAMDRTVFDAGSLGALTPAYASLEMLVGKEPDTRDDVYALGCIAYEMLTGEHPFNRIPADEAYKSRLKPRKISGLKKRQWKAIEKALAFRREDRVKSVQEFYQLIQPRVKSASIAVSTTLVLIAIAAATYFIITNTKTPEQQTAIQVDEIEFKIRYDLFKGKIDKLIGEPSFSSEWEAAIWEEVSGMTSLLGKQPDAWLAAAKSKIYEMYMNKYGAMVQDKNYEQARTLLTNAYRYAIDTRVLDEETRKLAEMIRLDAERKKSLAEEQRRAREVKDSQVKEDSNRTNLFDLALKNVNQQLQCQSRLNMRDFGIAVDKLRSLDPVRYNKMENSIVITLAECISEVGKTQPDRALEAKNYAMRIFNNNRIIAEITIIARDACDKSIAGLGARGDRSVCRDKIAGVGTGPAMVVIPGGNSIQPFAISKYEISVKELNQFCLATQACKQIASIDDAMPAVNINISIADAYVKWLSNATKHKYRLPTQAEWSYAANATNRSHDPNRNCQLNTRGIEKGGQLVRANAGVQNSWGLVNYLGNAQEWIYDKNRNLMATGGSFQDPMERCIVDSAVSHTGTADHKTGFRVIRELPR